MSNGVNLAPQFRCRGQGSNLPPSRAHRDSAQESDRFSAGRPSPNRLHRTAALTLIAMLLGCGESEPSTAELLERGQIWGEADWAAPVRCTQEELDACAAWCKQDLKDGAGSVCYCCNFLHTDGPRPGSM